MCDIYYRKAGNNLSKRTKKVLTIQKGQKKKSKVMQHEVVRGDNICIYIYIYGESATHISRTGILAWENEHILSSKIKKPLEF